MCDDNSEKANLNQLVENFEESQEYGTWALNKSNNFIDRKRMEKFFEQICEEVIKNYLREKFRK